MIGERVFGHGLSLWAISASSLLLLTALGCDAGGRPPGRDGGGRTDATIGGMCVAGMGGFRCVGNEAVECLPDGSDGARTNCVDSGRVCVAGVGCTVCQANTFQCNGNNVERCNATGTGWDPSATCDAAAGQTCNSTVGACTSPCDDAANSNSYIGCEYWPVTTLNSQVNTDFSPAVVVSNPQTSPAMITVTGPGGFSQTRTVPAGGAETVELPWVDALKGTTGEEASAVVRGGAYRVQSTLPVTVYQFNPLEYRLGRNCSDESPFSEEYADNECFSFSNDASLLLPTHVMTGNYIAMARPSMLNQIDRPGLFGRDVSLSGSPGFITIVGVSPTPVTVNVQYRGRVVGGSGVSASASGDTGSFTLNQGDVVQLVGDIPTTCTSADRDVIPVPPDAPTDEIRVDYCRVGPDYDLTGTEIRATGPVQVISGHNCTFIPYNRWACDHVEEAMFPLETWGTETIVSATQPLRSEPNVVSVMSGSDGNSISFDPMPSGVSPTTLNRGQVLEFEASESFRISGTAALMVTQALVGQDYAGISTGGDMGEGDPALSLGIPTEQFRTSYSFLAPTTYTRSYVNVTAPSGATVTLDGGPVTGFTPVGGTGFSVARIMISGGQHNISSDQAFGIVVYGFGSYTSYMYPGGLDFEEINPLI